MQYSCELTKWMVDRGRSYRRETASSANKKTPKSSLERQQTPQATFTPSTNTTYFTNTATQLEGSFVEPSQYFPETDGTYLVLKNQVDFFRRVTRAWGHTIRHILIVLELPRRRNFVRNTVTIDEEHSYVPSVDLIIDTLQHWSSLWPCTRKSKGNVTSWFLNWIS